MPVSSHSLPATSLASDLLESFAIVPEVREFGEMFRLRDRPEFRLILLDVVFPKDPFTPGAR
jgi:hypothetical protein